jgi:hypothetical protein
MAGLRLINPMFTAGCRGDYIIVKGREFQHGKQGTKYIHESEMWEKKARAGLMRNPPPTPWSPEDGDLDHVRAIFNPQKRPRGPTPMTQGRIDALSEPRSRLKPCRPWVTPTGRPKSASTNMSTADLRGALRGATRPQSAMVKRSASMA